MARPTVEGEIGVGQVGSLPSAEDFQQEFIRDSRAFDALLPALLGTRLGRFVAIYKGEMIDEDEDEFALARRMEVSHRSEFVLVRRVCTGEPEEHMQSPEAETR
jgi:hypothetical protein